MPGTTAPPRALVVDDAAENRMLVSALLIQQGFTVAQAADGEDAVQQAKASPPDLIVLDIGLPDIDGVEVCRRVRDFSDAHVLMLTAQDTELDKVVGFEAGADDYVTKPFSVAELIARINAIFRRQARMVTHSDEIFTIGTWQINARKHTMSRGRTSKRLTFYELEVLKLLRERADETVSRDELLEKVWGIQASPTSRTVDNFIVKLRRKLEEDQKNPRHILTVYGLGYKLVP